jgi:hypothetical protein
MELNKIEFCDDFAVYSQAFPLFMRGEAVGLYDQNTLQAPHLTPACCDYYCVALRKLVLWTTSDSTAPAGWLATTVTLTRS